MNKRRTKLATTAEAAKGLRRSGEESAEAKWIFRSGRFAAEGPHRSGKESAEARWTIRSGRSAAEGPLAPRTSNLAPRTYMSKSGEEIR